MSITSNAVLVRLSTQTFRKTVTDTDVSEEVTRSKNADADAGRFVKTLFSSHAMRPFAEVQSAAQKLLRTHCKPWDLGTHILAMNRFEVFNKAATALVADFDTARDRLVYSLPHHIQEARYALGDLFDETLYPDADILRKHCKMEVRFLPVPSDLYDVRIGNSVAAEKMKEAIVAAHDEFANAVAVGLQSSLSSITKRLEEIRDAGDSGSRVRFSKSLIENMRKAITDADTYNFAGDAKITTAVNHMRDNLLYRLDCIPLELASDDPVRTEAVALALDTARQTQMDMGGLL